MFLLLWILVSAFCFGCCSIKACNMSQLFMALVFINLVGAAFLQYHILLNYCDFFCIFMLLVRCWMPVERGGGIKNKLKIMSVLISE